MSKIAICSVFFICLSVSGCLESERLSKDSLLRPSLQNSESELSVITDTSSFVQPSVFNQISSSLYNMWSKYRGLDFQQQAVLGAVSVGATACCCLVPETYHVVKRSLFGSVFFGVGMLTEFVGTGLRVAALAYNYPLGLIMSGVSGYFLHQGVKKSGGVITSFCAAKDVYDQRGVLGLVEGGCTSAAETISELFN